MNVTREVILDLLPVYLAGEASPATPPLVEEFLRQDEELARRIRQQWVESLAAAAPSALPPDLELRSLKRTRRLLGAALAVRIRDRVHVRGDELEDHVRGRPAPGRP